MVKETKIGKKRKKSRKRTIAILSFAVIMGTIIILSALTQKNLLSPPRKPANEYFTFSDVIALQARPADPQNNSIIIKQVVFTITSVRANATDIEIMPLQGMVSPDEYPFIFNITQGRSMELEDPIIYTVEVRSTKVAGLGYPLDFYIRSYVTEGEATYEAEGKVTVYVTKFYP